MEQKFYVCAHCGNIIAYLENSGVKVVCCGEPMKELVPGTVDASKEKHVPAVNVSGSKITVQVGSVLHPMTKEHYIKWIFVQTKQGNQRKVLNYTDKPEAEFMMCEGDEFVTAYAYCNLHKLWKS